MIDPYFGSLGTNESEKDYRLGNDVVVKRASLNYYDNKIEYDQREVSKVSCTIHGAMAAVSDLTGYTFSLEERKEIWNKAIELGANPDVGWYTRNAVDLVREHWNAKGGAQLKSFRSEINSGDTSMMLRLGYSAVISHRGNKNYNKDKSDGILDSLEFGTTTYGHVLRMCYSAGDPYDLVINNYANKETNTYKIPTENIGKLLLNRVLFPFAYFYVLDFEDKNPEVPLWAKASVDKALELELVDEMDDLTEIVMNAQQEKMLHNLGLLNKLEGGVSLMRWLVMLDRMKQLNPE